MKTLLSILALLFSIQIINFQEIIGKYQIQDKGYFSTIELKEDKSFTFKYRGSSCYFWLDKIGKWNAKGNTLILVDSFEWKEETVIMEESIDNSSNGQIVIEFVNKYKEPIKNLSVEYDDVGGSEFSQKGITNEKGIVTFKPIKAKYHPDKDQARLEFFYKEFEDEVSMDIFPKLINNKVSIEINSTPRIEKRERIENYKIVGNELIGLEGNSLDSGMKYKKEKKN